MPQTTVTDTATRVYIGSGIPFDFDPYYEGVAGVGDIYAICPAGQTAVLAHGSF